ncbi:hypothetical protein MNBD_GAMMA16-189 [hydrothermal vent metagenome]|uniref:Transglutaminase-like domain-containing protein n=1 Tax=hydrothermal vent metagenome TaxID=652676 RepID=A0A3B0ZXX2_9ZZZZ
MARNIRKKVNKYTICAVLFCTLALPGYTLAESEFEQWQNQQKTDFTEYQSALDRQFSQFLEQQWQEFELFQGLVRDTTPKPIHAPIALLRESNQDNKASNGNSTHSVTMNKLQETRENTAQPVTLPPLHSKKKHSLDAVLYIDFFGGQLALVHNNPELAIKLKSLPSESSIAQFWHDLSSTNYQPMIDQLQLQKQALRLNDWGYIQLVQQTATKLYGNHKSEVKLFSWFILSHSGYRARVSYNGNKTYLMVSAKTPFFSHSYLTYEGINYYVVSTDGNTRHVKKLYSYAGHTPKGKLDIDLSFNESPLLTPRVKIKRLKFTYKGKEYQVNAKYNRNIADYLKNYPSSELSIYFQAAMSKELETSLIQGLLKIIKGKSDLDAVNLILRFVQTSFSYQTDTEQFGREKYFFPEELFVYDYSDCEDRSVLFAYLVRILLGLGVIGIDYPGHVATAVHFKEKVEGSSYFYNGKKYIVSDPTYINAPVGKIMPQVANKKAKIIPI